MQGTCWGKPLLGTAARCSPAATSLAGCAGHGAPAAHPGAGHSHSPAIATAWPGATGSCLLPASRWGQPCIFLANWKSITAGNSPAGKPWLCFTALGGVPGRKAGPWQGVTWPGSCGDAGRGVCSSAGLCPCRTHGRRGQMCSAEREPVCSGANTSSLTPALLITSN